MVLYPEVNGWFSTTIEKSILVKNVNDEEIKITLEADEEGKEFVRVHIVSQMTTLANELLKDGSNTEVAYSSQDPSTILKDIIDKYNGAIDYTATSVENTATAISYTFTFITYLEAIQKILELCPAWWYWYIDASNTIYLAEKNLDTDHKLYLGKEVISINARKINR